MNNVKAASAVNKWKFVYISWGIVSVLSELIAGYLGVDGHNSMVQLLIGYLNMFFYLPVIWAYRTAGAFFPGGFPVFESPLLMVVLMSIQLSLLFCLGGWLVESICR